jgi:5'(3')-deoxyribonucleotidase
MRIGVDIDSVVCEMVGPLLKRINKKYNTNFKRNDIKEWNWVFEANGLRIDGETEIHEAMDTLDFILNLPVITGAKEGIDRLSKKLLDEIIFITSRRTCLKEPTITWIRKNFGDYKVHFTDDIEDSKNGYAVDVLIDDAAHHIESFAQKHRPAIVYDCPWNRNIRSNQYIKRAKDWADVIFWVAVIKLYYDWTDIYGKN